ncbi:MAG: LemA family protein [Actinomycetota bacterium]
MALIALIAAALVVLAVVISFNRFVKQRQLIDNSWANVETELRRRHDLIPNLVATVQGYATHERQTFQTVTEARTAAAAAVGGPEEHTAPERQLTAGLKQLLAVSEAYPELHASGSFLELQRELTTTEDRIQAARRLFNNNVREYNQRVESIPSLFVARVAGFDRRLYFEIEPSAAAVPSVRSTD